MVTRWVLWTGRPHGPEVEPLDEYWGEENGPVVFGGACFLAKKGGFQIPQDTYLFADVDASQEWYWVGNRTYGRNDTAILPREVDE